MDSKKPTRLIDWTPAANVGIRTQAPKVVPSPGTIPNSQLGVIPIETGKSDNRAVAAHKGWETRRNKV